MKITVTDMHTAGEPLRIVTGGYPTLKGNTLLEKRRYVTEHFDHIRRQVMLEPRGHCEMYGAIITEPTHTEADVAVLFMHNSGYSTMCGHATIALGRWLIDTGYVNKVEPYTNINLECPCGIVKIRVDFSQPGIPEVSFLSVPAFVHSLNNKLDINGVGAVTFDISYGGAFYAILTATALGLSLEETKLDRLISAGNAVSETIRREIKITHPSESDLGFLYGTIITDQEPPYENATTRNLCVFGDGQIDRSPTGSGVTARIALDLHKGAIEIGQVLNFQGLTGITFRGHANSRNSEGTVVNVSGHAFYSGTSEYIVEDEDPLTNGFSIPERMSSIINKN